MARPSAEQIRAGHAEIRRRYKRSASGKSGIARVSSFRRADVKRVLADRHGAELPDDRDGRAALRLLLELKLDGPAALQLAPWAVSKLDSLITAADSNWHVWSNKSAVEIAEMLGERLEVTFEEFKRLGLSYLRPFDVPSHIVDDHRAQRRRNQDRHRKRRFRRAAAVRNDRVGRPQATSTDPWELPNTPAGMRAKALAIVPLRDRNWWTIRQLTEYAMSKPLGAFEGLDYPACRQAVLRAARKLEKLGIVETKFEVEARGLKVLYLRWPMTGAELEAETQQLLEEVAAEQEASK